MTLRDEKERTLVLLACRPVLRDGLDLTGFFRRAFGREGTGEIDDSRR